ncbi:MAG: hypothetical protein K8T25_11415 [Planctomycetia bacterium]|nr:hypothetical protein [Planctomycetia bacterium]
MIYASDQETARQKMLDRYAETYGLESLTIHGRCEVFDDAERANINCGWSCGLMTCLTKDDALAFIQDWKVDHPAVAPSKPRRVSTLERDIRAFEDSHSRERALAET